MQLDALTHTTLKKIDYLSRLPELQLDLVKLQHGLYQQQRRFVVVVEGIDAAGKGGMIRRLVERMDPRGYRVHPIGAPNVEELKEHYLQRFWRRLPKQGQIAIFDRSWYGRVLVERVDKLIESAVWERAYHEINEFERQLTNDGIILVKLFLYIDKDEQASRFKERIETPRKRWKITEDDILTRLKWDDYQIAFNDMLAHTNTPSSPWHVIGANNKEHTRITCMEKVHQSLSAHINLEKVELLNPKVQQLAQQYLD